MVSAAQKLLLLMGGSGVDPLAPAAPVIVRLTAATDTGSSNSDAISSTANPQYTFNLPSGNPDTNKNIAVDDVLRLAHNGTSVGTVTITQNMIDDIDPIEIIFTESGTGSIIAKARLERGSHIGPWSDEYTWTRDATAPTLSNVTGVETGETTATITVDVAEIGDKLFYVVDQNTNTPSAAQVVAGQDQGGAAADKAGNETPGATGTRTFNLTGLTAGTTYKVFFVHRDVAGNLSAVATAAAFTTDVALTWSTFHSDDYTADSSGSYTAQNGATKAVTGGQFQITNGNFGYVYRDFTVVDARQYRVTFTIAGGTSTAKRIRLGTPTSMTLYTLATASLAAFTFTSSGTTLRVGMYLAEATGGVTGLYDDLLIEQYS